MLVRSLLFGFVFSLPALADTIVLKSGEKLEGRIVASTPEEVTIEVDFSPTIKEHQTVQRSQIDKLEQLGDDEIAFREIAALSAPDTATSPAVFDRLIADKFTPFLKAYSYSKHAPEVRAKINALAEEKTHFANGEIKFRGRWLTAQEYAETKGQVEPEVILIQMRELSDRHDDPGLLNAFQAFDKGLYTGAEAYPEAVDLARKSIAVLEAQVVTQQRRLPLIEAEAKKAVDLSPEAERPKVIAAQQAQKARDRLNYEAIKQLGVPFIPIISGNAEALAALGQAVAAEKARIAKLDTAAWKRSIALVGQARQCLAKSEITEAEKAVDSAAALWPTNSQIAALKDQIAKKKAALAASSEAQAKVAADAADLAKKVQSAK